jgi:hypothetical protein
MKNLAASPSDPDSSDNQAINLDMEQMSVLTGFAPARLESLLADLEARGLIESFECNQTVRYRLKTNRGPLNN